MLKLISTIALMIAGITILVIFNEKTKIFNKIGNKIKDRYDVIKYKRIANTAINDKNTIQDKYTKVLETNTEALQKGLDDYKEKQQLIEKINKLKDEIKELRRVIAEDMTPKKRKKKSD